MLNTERVQNGRFMNMNKKTKKMIYYEEPSWKEESAVSLHLVYFCGLTQYKVCIPRTEMCDHNSRYIYSDLSLANSCLINLECYTYE